MSAALVVVVGPIAAGKSTLAGEVADVLRERGESAVVVGLDTVAEMALPSLDWSWAHEVHGHLVRAWLATPVGTVVAEGPSTPAELDQLLRCVPADVGVLKVVLVTPYDVALRRALPEADRGLSKDPGFLRADHDRFQAGLPDLGGDLVLDGAGATAGASARLVVAALDVRRTSDPGPRQQPTSSAPRPSA